jgi:non-ribosomal peptide synthetase component E (peptide arylation enzyme)
VQRDDFAVVRLQEGDRRWAYRIGRAQLLVLVERVRAYRAAGYLRGLGIATFKLPERLELRDELPRNPFGKILKRELRDELRH